MKKAAKAAKTKAVKKAPRASKKATAKSGKKRCSTCRKSGHNARTCGRE